VADRVLFVDDDPALLRAICRSLDEKYEIETALSGLEALQLLDEQAPFACVVSDMKMPQMDGVELISRVKKRCQGIACIILTGNQDEATITRASEVARVDRLLHKPCPRGELIEAIDQAIQVYRVS
jgi:CheY-like chemotaxis protein